MSEVIFWESGGMSFKKVIKNGFHESKPVVYFCISGQIKGADDLERRHDVTIGNKWAYMSDEEKNDWKNKAKKDIEERLLQ